MEFVKMHGLGNDFIVVDLRSSRQEAIDYAGWARQWCERHTGVGADGLVLLLPSGSAQVRMRIFNPDGSEAEMCGNAIRCVALYLDRRGENTINLTVETLAGVLEPRLVADHGEEVRVQVKMGAPRLLREQIPMLGSPGPVVDELLESQGNQFRVTAVSMGNPHCVIFVPQVADVPLDQWGPALEQHPSFPRKANIEFVQVVDRHHLIARVWERGAGVTQACGTGACATVVAAILNGHCTAPVKVQLPGGELEIDWQGEGRPVLMTGPAVAVFHGKMGFGKETG